MKKSEEKRMVTSEQTESDLKYRGVQIAFRKYWIPLTLVLVGILIGMGYCANITNSITRIVIAAGVYLIIIISLGYLYSKIGGKYWNDIKDEKEPIKLERLPSIWWIFKRK
jgi:hypothetical protein